MRRILAFTCEGALTLLTLAYAGDDLQQVDQLLVQVRQELETVAKKSDTP